MLPVMHPDAAGVDIGAEEIFVAVPAERDADPVRSFGTFTRDLCEVADWLQRCRVQTVAMYSLRLDGQAQKFRPSQIMGWSVAFQE
jgi:hypothetical protein